MQNKNQKSSIPKVFSNFLKISIITVSIFTSSNVFAQFDTFKLEKYKLPDINFRSLDVSGSTNNSGYRDGFMLDSVSGGLNKNNSIGGTVTLNFSCFKNSQKYQRSQNVLLSNTSSFNNNKNDSLKSKNTNIVSGTNFRYYFSNRLYFKNNYFFETNLNLRYDNNYTKTDNDTAFTKSKYMVTTFDVPVLVGKGRIEPVEKARQALYILEELSKSKKLDRIPSNEEITELCNLLASLDNERFFDSRLKKISDLEKLDSFFVSKKLVLNNDITYYTILEDNYSNAQNPYRSSGKRFSIGAKPEYSYYSRNSESNFDSITSKNKSYQKVFGITGVANYLIERPINLYWQNTISFEFNSGYLTGKSTLNDSLNIPTENATFNKLSINYWWAYMPNTRTYSKLGFYTNLSDFFYKKDNSGSYSYNNSKSVVSGAIFNLKYYISPRLSFNSQAYIDYDFSKNKYDYSSQYFYNGNNYQKIDKLNYGLSIGFSYSIF